MPLTANEWDLVTSTFARIGPDGSVSYPEAPPTAKRMTRHSPTAPVAAMESGRRQTALAASTRRQEGSARRAKSVDVCRTASASPEVCRRLRTASDQSEYRSKASHANSHAAPTAEEMALASNIRASVRMARTVSVKRAALEELRTASDQIEYRSKASLTISHAAPTADEWDLINSAFC